MKHIKLFEQFINEANEEILAQGACKNAIFMAQKHVDGLLKKLSSANMVTSAKSKVEVYNRGYELRIDVKYDWKKTSEFPENVQNMIMILQSSIWIQPESFFESNLVDNGSARIEARAFKTSLDMPYKEHYPIYVVKSKADIKKVQKEYADLIKSQVEEMTKIIGL